MKKWNKKTGVSPKALIILLTQLMIITTLVWVMFK